MKRELLTSPTSVNLGFVGRSLGVSVVRLVSVSIVSLAIITVTNPAELS